jgi:tripartite-type tricarboxylate transporter receptor subunit TctC
MFKKILWRLTLFGAVAVLPCVPAGAQDYPSKQIHVYLGLAAGGGADLLTRYFADKLGQELGQSVIVENKPGSLGNLAAEAVAKSKPDGYTLLIAPNTTYSAALYMFKQLPFDPVKDFVPVTTLVRLPFVMVVNAQRTPVKSVAELTAFLKAKSDKGAYGAPTGTSVGASELYKSISGVQSIQVPYKTMQQALTELTNGEIDFLYSDATFVLEHVRAGRYRALAVTTDKRSAAAPELPTMEEAGVKGFYEISAWFAAALPGGTPTPIADKLNATFQKILATEETKKFALTISADTFPGSRQDMAAFQAREIEKWGKIAKLAKIEPQ